MRQIAILRGINVSGHRPIKMADLRALLEKEGLEDIETYIQSGNLAYDTKLSTAEAEQLISKAIEKQYGYDVPVIVRTAKELEAAIQANPYYTDGQKDIKVLHLTFLGEKPQKEGLAKLTELDTKGDEYSIDGQHIYLKVHNGYGTTKLNNQTLESKLKVSATTRNWKTTLKLLEMAQP